jgi:hypothetical protein
MREGKSEMDEKKNDILRKIKNSKTTLLKMLGPSYYLA